MTTVAEGESTKYMHRLKKLSAGDKVMRRKVLREAKRIHSLRGRRKRLKKVAMDHHMRAESLWWVSGVSPSYHRMMEAHLTLERMARRAARASQRQENGLDHHTKETSE